MELPSHIRILGDTWVILRDDVYLAARGKWGETLPAENEMRVTAAHGNALARETAIHELLHAISSKVAVGSDQLDETQVTVTSKVLLAVLRENPEFTAFLLEAP